MHAAPPPAHQSGTGVGKDSVRTTCEKLILDKLVEGTQGRTKNSRVYGRLPPKEEPDEATPDM